MEVCAPRRPLQDMLKPFMALATNTLLFSRSDIHNHPQTWIQTAPQPILPLAARSPQIRPLNTRSSYSHIFPFKSMRTLSTLLSPKIRHGESGRKCSTQCPRPFRKISPRHPAISPLLYPAAVELACSPEDLLLMASEHSITRK
jgi:hypothetical protein